MEIEIGPYRITFKFYSGGVVSHTLEISEAGDCFDLTFLKVNMTSIFQVRLDDKMFDELLYQLNRYYSRKTD